MTFFKNLLREISAKPLSKITKFQKQFAGQKCYIFGDGVSLKWYDLENFSDRVSFVFSMMPYHPQFSCLDARFLFLVEPYWFYPKFVTDLVISDASMPVISADYRKRFFNKYPDKNFILNLSNYPIVRGDNVFYVFNQLPGVEKDPGFISNRIDGFYGSIRMSITLAIYFGFTEITLVGCDYTHGNARSHHWYEKGEGVLKPQPDYHVDFFQMAQEYATLNTVTLDGVQSVVPAVKYKDLTGCDLHYRENNELLSEEILKILNSWHEYRCL